MMKQRNKVLILHGWESNSGEHWFQDFKNILEKDGFLVYVPDMPGTYFPKLDEWLAVVENFHPDENWILMGHSLGGVTILRYLEKAEKPVGKVILIATPIEPMKFNPIANFFQNDFDWSKIKSMSTSFTVLQEDADPLVPVSHGYDLSRKIGCELVMQHGFTHFDQIDKENLKKIVENTRISS